MGAKSQIVKEGRNKMEPINEYLGWHFSTGVLDYGDGRTITQGVTHEVTGPITLCKHGLHACKDIIHALNYAPYNTSVVAWVRLHGTVVEAADKAAASQRTYLAVAPCEMILHEFACLQAEQALRSAAITDARCWNVIRVKRLWMRGEASLSDLGAAREAALGAAREAAWEAALGAAWEAAREAAWEAALGAAWEAALGATRGAQLKLLTKMVEEALGITHGGD